MPAEGGTLPRPPSRAVSLALSASLVALWGVLRLAVFPTTVLPLTYALPLLICIWTRDRVALWGMAAIFVAFHTIKMYWLIPDDLAPGAERGANWGATVVNVAVAAVAVHLVIRLRERLEATLEQVRAQAEELARQNEELASQSEELSRQAEELSQQSEELASQNEELQIRSEEVATLLEDVERRGALLQTLLDTARSSASEHAGLGHIARAATDLFGEACSAAVIYERNDSGLRLGALAPLDEPTDGEEAPPDDLVALVMERGRTASVNQVVPGGGLVLAAFPGAPPFRAALCAPIQVGGSAFGALAVYCAEDHEWSEEEFRLVEWLADQGGRLLQTLRLQADLRAADERKSVFLATLSHELRNPLAAIRFALELIDGGRDRDGHAIGVMRRQCGHLVRLVDDLLDATRLTSNKIQIRRARIDLVPAVRQALEASRPELEATGHELHVALPTEPIWVDADGDRIAQVAANLLHNAGRYTPAGGRLSLSLRAEGGHAVLSVADTGVGIAREDLDRVFEMFAQGGAPGSGGLGIGLALVRGIVELHGGRVEAHSDGPGRGSEFRVLLPLASAPTVAAAPERETAGEARPRRVLVVDDNVDSANMMGVLLEMHGHRVHVAHDAESALAAAPAFEPDAALLDIGLPGVDGYELARRLRADARLGPLRLVALTGWGQDADRARAEAAGFDAHLTKPAEPQAVLRAIAGD